MYSLPRNSRHSKTGENTFTTASRSRTNVRTCRRMGRPRGVLQEFHFGTICVSKKRTRRIVDVSKLAGRVSSFWKIARVRNVYVRRQCSVVGLFFMIAFKEIIGEKKRETCRGKPPAKYNLSPERNACRDHPSAPSATRKTVHGLFVKSIRSSSRSLYS